MKRIAAAAAVILLVLSIWIITAAQRFSVAAPDLSPTPLPGSSQPLSAAQIAQQKALLSDVVKKSISGRPEIMPFQNRDVVVDQIDYSEDGATALIRLALVDKKTGQVIPSEPALVIAKRTNPKDSPDPQWKIAIPSDSDWNNQLSTLPASLIAERERQRYLVSSAVQKQSAQSFGGYKLPWAYGLSKTLTQSVDHVNFSCATCLYAFDFADGTMFPLLAAKGGVVKAAVWQYSNGDPSNTNYLILEDQSTTPTTYQVYYHLAYDSIPAALRTPGARVLQGQYIGDVDDTGFSTGHHLHFHVTTNYPYIFANIVDITFDDVTVNGGRPRQCWEAQAYPQYGTQCMPGDKYVSGNIGANPPTGDLTLPAWGAQINERNLTLSGWAKDDIAVTKIQAIANFNGSWVELGPSFSGTNFSTSIDLCAAGVPDGPFGLALRIWDREGNMAPGYPGNRQVIKNYACPPPPPACSPNANQVSIFANPDYSGTCKTFDIGSHDTGAMSPVGLDNLESLLVGSNVRAILYSLGTFTGRRETFEISDANTADNRIYANNVYSIRVQSKTALPSAPLLLAPQNHAGAAPTAADSVLLVWENGDGATSFKVELSGPGGFSRVMDWSNTMHWAVGGLAPGNYTWKVIARNSAGQTEASSSFTVSTGSLPAYTPVSAPYTYNADTAGNWTATGLWRRASVALGGRPPSNAWIFNNGSDYAGTLRVGDLTSPPITIPATGYYLKFLYFSDTEGASPWWDRRQVQISVDGAPFENLLQLFDDVQNTIWLESPAINLSAYAGKTVRIRFHFHTVDRAFNTGRKGWMIDDVRIINSPALPDCPADGNDSPATATAILLGQITADFLCPNGDVDYYYFDAPAGTRIGVDVDARSVGSPLDSVLTLLDSDGRSVLLEVDDEVLGELQDPLLGYTLARSGRYYLKLKAYDHPGVGAADYFYTLRLTGDGTPPDLSFEFPNNSWITSNPFIIKVNASDPGGSGVQRVEFYWHPADYQNGVWRLLGVDTNVVDGWQWAVDPAAMPGLAGGAIYARAYDFAGNARTVVAWDLKIDSQPPAAALQPLSGQFNTTAVKLSWTASDAQSGVDYVEIQYREGSGAWQNYKAIQGGSGSAYFIGKPGVSYTFRLRAVDRAGYASSFSEAGPVALAAASACVNDVHETRDNVHTGATLLELGKMSEHTFCQNDQDWVSFAALAGDKLLLRALPISGGAAARLSLFDANGVTLITEKAADGLGNPSEIVFHVAKNGMYYLRATPLENGLFGSDVRYKIQVATGKFLYLPFTPK